MSRIVSISDFRIKYSSRETRTAITEMQNLITCQISDFPQKTQTSENRHRIKQKGKQAVIRVCKQNICGTSFNKVEFCV